MIGGNGSQGQAGKHRQAVWPESAARDFQVNPRQLDVGGRQAGLEKIAEEVHAGFGALLLDIRQAGPAKLLLLPGRLQFLVHRVQFDIRRGSFQGRLLAGILQAGIGRVQPDCWAASM